MGKRLEELGLNSRGEFNGHYKTARGRLAAFLTDLDPLFHRLLTGDGLHAWDNIAFTRFDARRRRQFRTTEKRYFALLADVCREGPDAYSDVNAEFLDNTKRQAVLFGKAKHAPGAPTKELEDEIAVRLSQEARDLILRFRAGFTYVRTAKHQKGYRSDASELRKSLQALSVGYLPDEIAALIKGSSLRSAVTHYLARREQQKVSVTQATISRGRRRRRTASPTRRKNP